MTDEDIQAMKERQAARSPLGNSHWNAAYIDIAKLLFEVEALYRMMPGWQSVADGAPPISGGSLSDRVLLLHADGFVATGFYLGYVLEYSSDADDECGLDLAKVTHWMPLPPPPIKRES